MRLRTKMPQNSPKKRPGGAQERKKWPQTPQDKILDGVHEALPGCSFKLGNTQGSSPSAWEMHELK